MSTVTVRLMGGLANQMFQYAAGLSLARHRSAALRLNINSYATAEPDRGYLLSAFAVPEPTETGPDRARNFSRTLSRYAAGRRLVDLAAGQGLAVRYYREPEHCFDPGFYDIEAPCSINGYFQSPLYFAGVEAELRTRFAKIPSLSEAAAAALGDIEAAPAAVALHVRGGDYLRLPPGSLLAPLKPDYYALAMRVLAGLLGAGTRFFLFTDDMAHARAVLPAGFDVCHVATPSERPWEDLHLMARCRHNIIANSSFSWWGAWLGSAHGRIVVAPRRWFTAEGARRKNTCDLYPPGWILV